MLLVKVATAWENLASSNLTTGNGEALNFLYYYFVGENHSDLFTWCSSNNHIDSFCYSGYL
jgi:hypothetical protein